MEPRAFQGLFQDTKLNQNDLTEKSVLPKYKIMENYQWWNKTCFMWTIHLPGHSFKIYFGRFWKRVYLPPSSRALSKFGGGKKQCEVQYIFSYPKLRWRFLHSQIYSITFLYNTMQWIPYSLIFPLFYSCHGSRINVSFPQHTHAINQWNSLEYGQGLLVFCQQLQSQCIQKKKNVSNFNTFYLISIPPKRLNLVPWTSAHIHKH